MDFSIYALFRMETWLQIEQGNDITEVLLVHFQIFCSCFHPIATARTAYDKKKAASGHGIGSAGLVPLLLAKLNF